MRTVARIMVITAVMAGALSFGVAGTDGPGRLLQFELADGTVITGRIDARTIAFRISSGNVLKMPVEAITELTVGLNDRPGFVRRVEALVKALDSDKTRQAAQRKLIALGPVVSPIIKTHAAGGVSARRLAIGQVLKAYYNWFLAHGDEPEAMRRPIEPRSKLRAKHNTFLGTVAVDEFRIASRYGNVTVKLDDIHRIRPGFRAAEHRFRRWTIELRDKTRLRGVAITRSMRIKTRYGIMIVPLARIREAIFSADGKNIRLQCWGPGRITGSLSSKTETTISLKTDKGRVDIPVGKIAEVAYGPLTLKGHSHMVSSVAYSPDGKRLASGSWDGTVKIWEVPDWTSAARRSDSGESK